MTKRLGIVLVVAMLAVGACGGDDDSSAGSATTEPPDRSTTTAVVTTSVPPTVAPTTTAPPPLTPGASCPLGSDRDCIDPDGDGVGTYLIGGGDCMETFSPDSTGLCSDLDGDGNAGYPDSG